MYKALLKFAGIAEGGEELAQMKAVVLTRDRTRAEAQLLFGNADKARKEDVAKMDKLLVQAPAAQTMAPNLQKTAAANVEAFFEKNAKIFGAHAPTEIEHASIPYKHRREAYVEYLNSKSNEKPTGYLKGSLGGAAIGGALGGIAGMGRGGAGAGAGIGAAAGAIMGMGLASHDKRNIEDAKHTLKSGNIDRHLASKIDNLVRTQRTMSSINQERRHQELLGAMNKRASAVDRFPELLKVAGSRAAPTKRPATTTPAQSMTSGGAA